MESKTVAREGCGQRAGVRVCLRSPTYMCVYVSEQKIAVPQPGRSCEYGRPIGLADYHKICPMTFGRHSDSHVFG